mgnify:CR=1 FL=1
MSRTLSIIIPAYNEEATIEAILSRVIEVELRNSFIKELVVVDDASNDNTYQLVKKFQKKHPDLELTIHQHQNNQGKGASIQTGLAHCNGDYVIIQDADLEYDPEDYNQLLAPVLRADADVVYGSRFMGGSPHRILFFWHSLGNKFLTFLSNMFTDLNLTDMETGYKLFKRELLCEIDLQEKSFGFEPEVTAKIAKIDGIEIYEVGISYYGRTYAEGKKIGIKDGLIALWCILKYNLLPS